MELDKELILKQKKGYEDERDKHIIIVQRLAGAIAALDNLLSTVEKVETPEETSANAPIPIRPDVVN